VKTAILLAAWALSTACVVEQVSKAPRIVRDTEELRAALNQLGPGSQVWIAPGTYRGGHFLSEAQGTARDPIVIRAQFRDQPPVFEGGASEAWHLSDCCHLVLSDLVVRGYSGNGINVDDAGSFETPATDIRIERVTIEDTGPEGNHDALKMSGVDGFVVKDCRFAGWGGSAIDLVGCHDGVIEACEFKGRAGFTQSSGVQIKGGSARVRVEGCLFEDAGARAVNAGGSTGLDYFRPPNATWEAQDIAIERNVIHGSETPFAVVGAISVQIRDNELFLPGKWVLRILQESRDERFGACQGGSFIDNRVSFDHHVQTFVNVGPGTRPETFTFQGNVWIELGAAGEALPAPRQPVWPPQ